MGYVPMPLLTPEEFHRAMDEIQKDIPRSEAARMIAQRGARVSWIGPEALAVLSMASWWLSGVLSGCMIVRWTG